MRMGRVISSRFFPSRPLRRRLSRSLRSYSKAWQWVLRYGLVSTGPEVSQPPFLHYRPLTSKAEGDRYDDDASKYVALKIEISSRNNSQELDILRIISTKCANDPDAENVIGIINSFIHQGPNGKHRCLVSRPMGPSVSSLMNRYPNYLTRFPKDQAKRVLRSILQGIRFLHANGIVHGDLQSGNFLFFIQDIDSISPDGLRQDESSPGVTFVRRRDGKIDKWAPRYLVEAKPLSSAEVQVFDDRVGICDFGGG